MKPIFLIVLLFFVCFSSIDFLYAKPVLPQIAPESVMGTTGYYRWRYLDFMKRHTGLIEPDSKHIPDYYLEYGEKYALRFSNNLYPKVSDKGKLWMIQARLNLQMAIEKRCKNDLIGFSRLEESPKAFRKFAFGTHQDSYMDAGLSKVPILDLIKIATTPDLKDLLTKDGRSQIFGISRELGKDRLKKFFGFIRRVCFRICKSVQLGNLSEVEQMVSFVEGLSESDQRVINIVTIGFRTIRQEIQFRLIHNEDSNSWKNLLERIKQLRLP